MPRRIHLHPGFHKTGTSSIQHFLWSNRQRIATRADLRMLRHLAPVTKLCAAYSRSANPLFVVDMVEALDAAFADPPLCAEADLLISTEGLAGHLPGWPGVEDYAAAPVTIGAVVTWAQERFPQAAIDIVLTTRDPGDWLSSAWRHHLLGQRLRQDEAAFAEAHRAAADLGAAAADLAGALAPVPVRTLPLETAREHRLGPGGALLATFGWTEAEMEGFEPVGHGNRGPRPDLAARLLELNRSDMPDPRLAAEKAALARAAGLAGWAPSPAGTAGG
ncbi:hypothetical protein [Wenxinia saemankumensis]|uniref:Sulfotransferase family protein n=1 Tax=Wenxinia saemankumensis TaxID=1447782 RepID=A0A1M6GT56_9RHOB|nr:hypothetical protein [Wenxinia saemankumensis]SHJ13090.1 hypothetical protein SAMN05444417_2908 [Wenxinia saemankumensis]